MIEYLKGFLIACGIAGVADVFFFKGRIGVILSEWIFGLFKK